MLRLKDKIEANVTYADHAGTADSAKVATKLGSTGVGNMANFIYLNAGIPTASTSTIGGSSVPIYMKSGVMTQCAYTLKDACSKAVRTRNSVGDSGWRDNATDDLYVPTMSFMAFWDGAYSGSASNLTYCKHGAFGTIVTKNAGDYAAAGHTHSYLPLSGGTMSGQIRSNNTGSLWIKSREQAIVKASAPTNNSYNCVVSQYTNSGEWSIGSLYGEESLIFSYTTDANYNAGNNQSTTVTIDKDGGAHFNAVYNAVYNDYAEFFPRGEATEPGDIVALDLSSDHESYIKATATSKIVAGVHSDEYAMLIGGDKVDDGNYVEKNLVNYIPVSLAGRVMCKVTGPVHRGDTIIVSEIPGVGIATDDENIPHKRVVGYVVEDDDRTDIRRVKIRVKG